MGEGRGVKLISDVYVSSPPYCNSGNSTLREGRPSAPKQAVRQHVITNAEGNLYKNICRGSQEGVR